MFEYQHKPSFIAKALTLCAIGMGVGFGTCGLASLVVAGGGNRISGYIATAGMILFLLSFAGAIITSLVFLIMKILQIFQK